MSVFGGKAEVTRTSPNRRVWVESRCGAVALGRTYLLPPLSSGGASMVPLWFRFHIHRVTGGGRPPPDRVIGGGRPPPIPTERGVQISRTTLFGSWFASLLFVQVSFPWSADLLTE